jgi:hypothetical protein
MKLRHITAIFCFLAAFGLSIFLVGLSTPLSCSAPVSFEPKQTIAVNSEPELQARIRKFLEADRQTGHELSADLTSYRQERYSELGAEKMATFNLVKKMKKIECKDLPADFCLAWQEHVNAWSRKATFLPDATNTDLKFYRDLNKDYSKLTSEINLTYYRMLEVAEKYGVYFTY